MLPVIAIVGRPNVGKSTLFNRLAKKRDSLVDDMPGVTRDRLYASVNRGGSEFLLVDTGGFDASAQGTIAEGIRRQVEIAIEEADVIILMFDGKTGPILGDEELTSILRRSKKRVWYVVNKIDGPEHKDLSLEFYALGIKDITPVSAAHGYGITALMDEITREFTPPTLKENEKERIKIALIGRPNVGKSSLVNKIIGSNRLLVSETPGTTRDSVNIYFERKGNFYMFIDTAGIRRKTRVKEKIEKFSMIKALNAISSAHISIILIDSEAGLCEQDIRICGYALDEGCGMIIAFNKWDLIKNDRSRVNSLNNAIDRQLDFIPFVPRLNISALTGENVRKVFSIIENVWDQYNTNIATPFINDMLKKITEDHPPPYVGGRMLKFFYSTQVSVRPPVFVIFVNRPADVIASYKRYIINQFRKRLGLHHIPIKIFFRAR